MPVYSTRNTQLDFLRFLIKFVGRDVTQQVEELYRISPVPTSERQDKNLAIIHPTCIPKCRLQIVEYEMPEMGKICRKKAFKRLRATELV